MLIELKLKRARVYREDAPIFNGRFSATIEVLSVISSFATRVNRLLVANGQYECVYANMPQFGLAMAGGYQPATGHLRDARSRMKDWSSQLEGH